MLVGSEAGKAEQCQGLIARAFGWQEVAVVHATMRIDQFDPPASETLEGIDLRRNDYVLNHASDHASG